MVYHWSWKYYIYSDFILKPRLGNILVDLIYFKITFPAPSSIPFPVKNRVYFLAITLSQWSSFWVGSHHVLKSHTFPPFQIESFWSLSNSLQVITWLPAQVYAQLRCNLLIILILFFNILIVNFIVLIRSNGTRKRRFLSYYSVVIFLMFVKRDCTPLHNIWLSIRIMYIICCMLFRHFHRNSSFNFFHTIQWK